MEKLMNFLILTFLMYLYTLVATRRYAGHIQANRKKKYKAAMTKSKNEVANEDIF